LRVRGTLAALALHVLAVRAAADDGPDAATIRAARDAVFSRPEFRYDDAAAEESVLRRILAWWQGVVRAFQEDHPVLFLVLLGFLGLVLAAIVAHLVWTWRVARSARWDHDDPRDLESALRRLDPAPFRTLADEHARAGRLDEALRALYTALLLTLDRRGALRYAGHKAFLDYRIEAARDDEARAALDRFADEYPPGSFGRRPPDAAHFAGLAAVVDSLAGRTSGSAP
jgi:hypothetical protein